MEPIRVVVAGATGKVGRELCRAVLREPGFRLVGAVGRRGAGRDVGEALGLDSGAIGIVMQTSLADALAAAGGGGADVLIDFSTAALGRESIPVAIGAGLAPVIGTTGFGQEELDGWARACRAKGLGGAFVANFAIGAMLMMRWAAEARRFFPDVEIVELHHQTKLDAPSGTALRTRQRLQAARGNLGGPEVPIHSVRLPGMVAHQEVIFGGPGQVLTVRHDTTSREAFVPGVLMACKWVLERREVAFDLEDLVRS